MYSVNLQSVIKTKPVQLSVNSWADTFYFSLWSLPFLWALLFLSFVPFSFLCSFCVCLALSVNVVNRVLTCSGRQQMGMGTHQILIHSGLGLNHSSVALSCVSLF